MQRTVDFDVTPNQYEEFRLSLAGRAKLQLGMIATHKVNVMLLSGKEMHEYEFGGRGSYDVTYSWSGITELDEKVALDAGRWHLVVEGHTAKSRGKILIST